MEPLAREQIERIGLPKWPQIVVAGETITREQTYEILIRTNSLYFGCNDQEWENFCRSAFGLPKDSRMAEIHKLDDGTPEGKKKWREAFDDFFDQEQKAREVFRVLRLGYLGNDQIACAFIHGPHGWLDWAGQIGCNAFNIGKWPSTADVFDEWAMIAREWPFLQLRCQLYNAEQCEEGGQPVIEYRVREGHVTAHLPKERLITPHSGTSTRGLEESMQAIFHHRRRERGCSPQVLLEAIKVTKEALARRPKELADEADKGADST